jgi:hypothetical protein
MVDVRLVDLGIVELDRVRQETTETAAPLNHSGDGHPKHQIIALYVIDFIFVDLLDILEMLGGLFPRNSLAVLASGSLKTK